MHHRRAFPGFVIGALALSLVAGCRGQTTEDPPIVPLRNMYDQQRFDPQAQTMAFPDGRTMRPPVPHTVPREAIVSNQIGEGLQANGSDYVMTIPRPALQKLGGMEAAVERGQERYNIYCTPCHDATGSGKGLVIERGMLPPPSFHTDRIRHMPDGQLFATISNGIRNMPAYGPQIQVYDRWAIVAYVRALQLSQAEAGTESDQ